MAEMGLRGEEQLECDFGGFWGGFEEVVWVVGLGDCCADGFLFLACKAPWLEDLFGCG